MQCLFNVLVGRSALLYESFRYSTHRDLQPPNPFDDEVALQLGTRRCWDLLIVEYNAAERFNPSESKSKADHGIPERLPFNGHPKERVG